MNVLCSVDLPVDNNEKKNTVVYRKRLQYTDEYTWYVVDIIGNGLEENEKKSTERDWVSSGYYVHIFIHFV